MMKNEESETTFAKNKKKKGLGDWDDDEKSPSKILNVSKLEIS
jgi:hypothetical protein